MRYAISIIALLLTDTCIGQPFDTSGYNLSVQSQPGLDGYFKGDLIWRGGDGASSVDLENGKVLWLFSDSFIAKDSSGSRNHAALIRNSIAIQNGTDLNTAPVKYFWNTPDGIPFAFFHTNGAFWFWPGHGTLIKDKLCIFLMKVHGVEHGLGFEIIGWSVALITNPFDAPSAWEMEYIDGHDTGGMIAGSAAVLRDNTHLYAYGAVEPGTHEVYLLRWKISKAYHGNFSRPEWWIDGVWKKRKARDPIPEPLFIGGTEFSVHYDDALKKYIQIQSFGFGEAEIGLRMSDHPEGPWTEPFLFYKPEYPGVKQPFMYTAKAHPELSGEGIYITYNVNSFDLSELIGNQTIYFPKFILISITEKPAR